jgi:hypothetical protein
MIVLLLTMAAISGFPAARDALSDDCLLMAHGCPRTDLIFNN